MSNTTPVKRRPLTIEETVEGLAIILRKLDKGSREIAGVMFQGLADDLNPNAIQWRANLLRVMAKEQPPTVDTRPKAPVINMADVRAKLQPAAPKASKPRKVRAVDHGAR
jgi:hypothetical protein